MHRPAVPSRAQHGFTLIEVIIAAGLIALLAKTATFFWVDGLGLARSVNADSAAIADGRAALERLAREIREVKYNPISGAYCITLPAPPGSLMVFHKTAPGVVAASACGTTDMTVTIQSSSNNVYLAYSPEPPASLAANASSFALAHLQADAVTAATNASNVRYVRLTLTQQPAGVQATTTSTLVALRNN